MMNAKARVLSWIRAPATEAHFESLYHQELPRIYNFFRYRVGDGPVAEDLTADTFEKAWRHRQRYRHDLASFSTWLFTIARRVAVDHYRKHRSHIPLEKIVEPVAVENIENLAERRSDFERLNGLLHALEDRERELVALRYGAGLTQREIADLTDLTVSNVGVILHRTVKKLRIEWENES